MQSKGHRPLLHFLSALAIISIAAHLLFVLSGFYFTGDTISYTQFSQPSSRIPLYAVFAKHSPIWPPLQSFIFALLRTVPVETLVQHQLFVVLTTGVLGLTAFLITRLFTQEFRTQAIFVSMLLLTGVHHVLFKSAIPEVLLVICWLLAVYAWFQFTQTKAERYLFVVLIAASMAPLARYIGIIIPLTVSICSVGWYLRSFRTQPYALFIFVVLNVGMYVPIGIFLLRNMLTIGELLTNPTPQWRQLNLWTAYTYNHAQILHSFFGPAIGAFAAGALLQWKHAYWKIVGFGILSLVLYQLSLTVSTLQFSFDEHFPARYVSPMYPMMLLVASLVASNVFTQLAIGKKLVTSVRFFRTSITPGIVASVLLVSCISQLQLWHLEVTGKYSFTESPKFSRHIAQLCKTEPPLARVLVMKNWSMNWVAQSLKFYCAPIELIPEHPVTYTFTTDTLVLSAYPISDSKFVAIETDNTQGSTTIYDSGGETPIYQYRATAGAVLESQVLYQAAQGPQ